MGEVYLARRDDEVFQRRVAIKVVRGYSDRDALLRRFRSERQILASLDHPNIAQFLDGGSDDDGNPYLVMEFIEGLSIDRYCDESRLTVRERIELVIQVCDAVQSAHQKLVVHRDIKPNNVLVTPEGVPKLLDFGIAKILQPDLFPHTVELTQALHGPLTPLCASPEQLLGHPIGTASDVYSLGVLLYKLLTGRYPRQVDSLVPEAVRVVLGEDVALPSRVALNDDKAWEDNFSCEQIADRRRTQPRILSRQLSGDLDTIVQKALAVESRLRYASMEGLRSDLQAYLDGLPIEARPQAFTYWVGKFVRRHRIPLSVIILLVLTILTFSSVMTFQTRQLAVQRDQVLVERQKAETVSDFMVGLFDQRNFGSTSGEDVTVRQMLDLGGKRLPMGLEDQPEIEAELLVAIGKVFENLGLASEAADPFRRVVELREEIGKPLRIAGSKVQLASILSQIGQVNEGRKLAAEALETARQIFPPSDLGLFTFIYSSSLWEENMGDLQVALELVEEAAQLIEHVPSMSRRYAFLWERQAFLLLRMGDSGRALQLAKSAYERLPEDAGSRLNLGVFYREVGDYSTALKIFEDGLGRLEPFDGFRHERVSYKLQIALTLIDMGELVMAEEELQPILSESRALALEEPANLRRGMSLALAHLYVARIAVQRGESAQAAENFEESLKAIESFGDSVWVRLIRSRALLGLGRVDEARPLATNLLAQGWRYRRFDELCALHGIFPPESADTASSHRVGASEVVLALESSP